MLLSLYLVEASSDERAREVSSLPGGAFTCQIVCTLKDILCLVENIVGRYPKYYIRKGSVLSLFTRQAKKASKRATMKFRPCIDLHSGQVKQIVGSTLTDDKQNALTAKSDSAPAENFATDKPASEFADMYKRDGLTGGHVIMLGPGNVDAVSL